MSEYRVGLTAAFWTLSDIGRGFVPQPEQLDRARATLSDLRAQIGTNLVVRFNEDLVRKADNFLDKVAVMGTAGLGTSDRADAREYAEAMVEFASEMECAL